ncbi:MAG: hypothetical protein GY861_11535 [bacterium]|nr:hypothetical protein [bacterium]
MGLNLNPLTKEPHFPIIRAVLNPIKGWRKLFSIFTYSRKWEVMEDYFLWSDSLQRYIFIPKGFIYDAASVLKLLKSIYSGVGILFMGSGPHDFGYRYNGLLTVNKKFEVIFLPCTKFELDKIFNGLCIEENKLPIGTSLATGMLLIAGYPSWWKHRRKNKNANADFPELFIS